MTDIRSDEYWATQFDITQDDLKRIAERLERDGAPQDLKAIALRLIRGRLEHGHDISPAALQNMTGKESVRLWDPEKDDWKIGDLVMVAHDHNGNSKYEPFLGEIIFVNSDSVKVKLEGLRKELSFTRTLPGSENAKKYNPKKWREAVRRSVEEKYQSQDINQQSEGILLRHGESILSRLAEALQADLRFAGLENKWYAAAKLPKLDDETLQTVHRKALENPGISLEELLPGEGDATLLRRMALRRHLQHAPQKFENIGTPARPQWRARLPEPDQAKVTHYAYDPQTFEILCRPGQKLSQKKAQRLQELGLYAHVVTFAE